MNIDDVMEEIAATLEAIPGLRVHPHPMDAITPPAAEVLYPDIEYDKAFQRGLSQIDGGIIVSVSRTVNRAARQAIARYASDEGEHSIHGALYARTLAREWTSCSYARVARGYGVDHVVGDIPYVSYRFDLAIAGPRTS